MRVHVFVCVCVCQCMYMRAKKPCENRALFQKRRDSIWRLHVDAMMPSNNIQRKSWSEEIYSYHQERDLLKLWLPENRARNGYFQNFQKPDVLLQITNMEESL